MLAIRVDVHGGPEVLRPVTVPEPTPGPGEVVVRHEAIGVNFVDAQHRAGSPYPVHLPLVPGIEAAGNVVEIGEGVQRCRPGDRVAYAGPMVGAYAELATVPEELVVGLPTGISASSAAAVLLQGMTAHVVTHDVYTPVAGQSGLVHAGAGGTGWLIVQFLMAAGVRVIATASSDEKADALRSLGVADVIVSRRSDVAEAVRRLVPGGVDVVFDSVGRATFETSLRAVRPKGTVVAFGQSSGPVPPMDVARLSGLTGEGLPGSVWLTWPTLLDYNAGRAALETRAADVFDAVLNGTLTPVVAETIPLVDAERAHRLLDERKVVGKILLNP